MATSLGLGSALSTFLYALYNHVPESMGFRTYILNLCLFGMDFIASETVNTVAEYRGVF